jgi:hypothetical protein
VYVRPFSRSQMYWHDRDHMNNVHRSYEVDLIKSLADERKRYLVEVGDYDKRTG